MGVIVCVPHTGLHGDKNIWLLVGSILEHCWARSSTSDQLSYTKVTHQHCIATLENQALQPVGAKRQAGRGAAPLPKPETKVLQVQHLGYGPQA